MGNSGVILLIDSDPILNNANQCALHPRGYTVLTATSFSEARALLAETEPDIILIEAILPDGDGFDFCKEIYGTTTASIVFLTSKSDDKDMVRGLELGADEYIRKPCRVDLIIARVEVVMRRRRRGRIR